jgi:hypothetical protein
MTALQEGCLAENSVEIIVRSLTDAKMIRIMANENMEEWGSAI